MTTIWLSPCCHQQTETIVCQGDYGELTVLYKCSACGKVCKWEEIEVAKKNSTMRKRKNEIHGG